MMTEKFDPIQKPENPSFVREPHPLQDHEVRSRIQEYNRIAGIEPVYEEKVQMPSGFIDTLMDGNHSDSFNAWNLLRRGRMNVISITVDRKDGIVIQQARSSNDVRQVEGQCKSLLYGNKRDCEQAWMGLNRNVLGMKVDVRQPYVTSIKGATD